MTTHIYKLAGRKIDLVWLGGTGTKAVAPVKLTRVPRSGFMPTFEVTVRVKGGQKTFLVLDPYGDETICSPELCKRIFMDEDHNYTLAIETTTGEMRLASFDVERGRVTLYLAGSPCVERAHRLPKKFLKELAYTKTCKRPFWFTIDERSLVNFMNREIGYSDLRDKVNVVLEIRGKGKNRRYLEIESYSEGQDDCGIYRVISAWM